MGIKNINIWYLSSLLISIIVAIPIFTVFSSFFETTGNYSSVVRDTFFYSYISNSLTLLIGVLVLTFIIGVSCAYLVSFYKFPGSNFFKWALILSFAVPAYIYAYSLTAFFENYGTAFTILKNLFGDGNYNSQIPKFDGMLGAIISISFSLFGYVYVLTRASFHYQSQNLIELGKNLGFSKKKSFLKIILPSARPAIVAGLSLVAMETLSDFGSVSFFGISTLTTGIYNAWISFDDLALANRLSFYLLIFILGLFVLENLSRKKAQYHSTSKGGFKSKTLTRLYGYKSVLALIFCFTVFFISFLFPVLQMLYWTIIFPKHLADLNLIELFFNTILLVFLSSIVLISLAFISNYGNRVSRSKFLEVLTTFSISGYAIP
jgi:iron(III) transport system permease protein